MFVCTSNNLNQSYLKLYNEVEMNGELVGPRGIKTKEIRPVLIEYTNPRQRLVTCRPGTNLPFQVAETLWQISGRGDREMIRHYLKNIDQFADDPYPEFNASYGQRIRKWGYDSRNEFNTPKYVDQLEECYLKLKNDNDTRQAVITLWNPLLDNSRSSRDFPCLTGDTLILSPQGHIRIDELIKKFESSELNKYPVYSMNELTKKKELKWAINGVRKGKKPVYRVTLDNGTYVDATENHVFYVKETHVGYPTIVKQKILKDLKHNDRLFSLYFIKTRKNISLFIGKSKNNRFGIEHEKVLTWNLYNGQIPTGYDVHHKNHNPHDNRIENLELKKHGDHSSDHQYETNTNPYVTNQKKIYPSGPIIYGLKKYRNITKEQLLEFGKEIYKKHGKFSWRLWHKESNGRYPVPRIQHEDMFGSFYNFKKHVIDNHKVVKVEYLGEQEVYDIEVEDNHNFYVNDGVLVHNCNFAATIKIRDNKLDWTTYVRSNDLIYGTGTNLWQFSHFMEILAGWLDVEVGTLRFYIDSLHVYQDSFYEKEKVKPNDFDIYKHVQALDARVSKDKFDNLLKIMQISEEQWRKGDFDNIVTIENKYWFNFMQVLRIFNLVKYKQLDSAVDAWACLTNEYKYSMAHWIIKKIPLHEKISSVREFINLIESLDMNL